MTKLVVDITISLDGFIAGPGISTEQPLGKDGEQLHNWIFKDKTPRDGEILSDVMETTGVVIIGNGLYSTAIDNAWNGVTPFHAPAIVVCHKEPQTKVEGFTYCTTGIRDALNIARKITGDKNIWIMGGANLIQQFLKAGWIDVLQIHIAPVLLMKGARLFKKNDNQLLALTKTRLIETPGATHIQYQAIRKQSF